MHLGFGVPMAGDWATPHNHLRVARAAEDLGSRPPHIERLAHHSLRGDSPRPGAEEDHRGLVRSG